MEESETIPLQDLGAGREDLTHPNTEDIRIVNDGNRPTAEQERATL